MPPPVIRRRSSRIERTIVEESQPTAARRSEPSTIRSSDAHVPIARTPSSLLYTDGITEFARDSLAGEAALRRAVRSLVGNSQIARPATRVATGSQGEAPARDDVAVLVFQFSPVDRIEVRRRRGRRSRPNDGVFTQATRVPRTWRASRSRPICSAFAARPRKRLRAN